MKPSEFQKVLWFVYVVYVYVLAFAISSLAKAYSSLDPSLSMLVIDGWGWLWVPPLFGGALTLVCLAIFGGFEMSEKVTLCPCCGASTFLDTHCPASDHPELEVEFDSCTHCDWPGNDRPIGFDVKYSRIKELPESGFFQHFPGIYCKRCKEIYALYSYSAHQPDGTDDQGKPFYDGCGMCGDAGTLVPASPLRDVEDSE